MVYFNAHFYVVVESVIVTCEVFFLGVFEADGDIKSAGTVQVPV